MNIQEFVINLIKEKCKDLSLEMRIDHLEGDVVLYLETKDWPVGHTHFLSRFVMEEGVCYFRINRQWVDCPIADPGFFQWLDDRIACVNEKLESLKRSNFC